jgi:hypothetical protein
MSYYPSTFTQCLRQRVLVKMIGSRVADLHHSLHEVYLV